MEPAVSSNVWSSGTSRQLRVPDAPAVQLVPPAPLKRACRAASSTLRPFTSTVSRTVASAVASAPPSAFTPSPTPTTMETPWSVAELVMPVPV